ncbi:class I SAM-dependent methyltransferase [soil metagenome]
MQILTTTGWDAYELLDAGDGHRLERFGKYTLVRPDPQICWKPTLSKDTWNQADAFFVRTKNDVGEWKKNANVPDRWLVTYKDLSFWAEPTPFKHTGIFPEQHLQWDWMRNKIREANRQTNILNLFGYTGIASIAVAAESAKVTHLDASKPSVTWAHENQIASGLQDKPIRWIIDDAIKFTAREIKRGVKYDGIVMDPPIYGHGPNGERWDFMKDIPTLLNNCRAILSDDPLFMIINAYAISASALMLGNLIRDYVSDLRGTIEVGELVLEEKSAHRLLSTGIFCRWSSTKKS